MSEEDIIRQDRPEEVFSVYVHSDLYDEDEALLIKQAAKLLGLLATA